MNPEIAVKIFEAGKSAGADFVEIFEEETRGSALGLKDRKIETATAGTEYGIGIRLLYGTEVLYGFTSDDSEDALVKLVRTLAFGRIAASSAQNAGLAGVAEGFEFAPQKRVADYNVSAFKDPRILGQAVKQDFLFRADEAARKVSDKVVQVGATVTDSCSTITLFSSPSASCVQPENAAVMASPAASNQIFVLFFLNLYMEFPPKRYYFTIFHVILLPILC